MKRLLTFIAAVVCLAGTMKAESSLYCINMLKQGFTGEIELRYYPESSCPLYSAANVYSHIGVLTSASKSDSDIKYYSFGCTDGTYGHAVEPEWTKYGSGWSLTISDFYTYFNVPTTEDITGISIVMHDGAGSSAKVDVDRHGKPFILPIYKSGGCEYAVIKRSSEYSGGWNNGYLYVWDNGYRWYIEMPYSNIEPHPMYCYGEKVQFAWFKGSSTNEDNVAFDIISTAGKVVYSEDFGGGVKAAFELENLCSTEEGPYAIKNLKVTDKGANVFEFSWDANSKYLAYNVAIYNPDGDCYTYDQTEGNSITMNLGAATKNGTYKVEIQGIDERWYWVGISATKTFDVTIKDLGAVTARLLIPSDSELDVTKPVYFIWYNMADTKRDTVVMKQDGKSRWWTVTTDIPLPAFYYGFCIKTGEKTQQILKGGYCEEKEFCAMAGGLYYKYNEDGIDKDEYNMFTEVCDSVDHDYSVASAVAKAEDGKFVLEITPNKDLAYEYFVSLYEDEEVFITSGYTDLGQTTFEWINTDNADKKITSWRVQPYVWDDYYYSSISRGKAYYEKKDLVIANPYAVKNFKAEKGEENRYVLSWDAYDNATAYKITVSAPGPGYILDGTYEVGQQIKKVGDKYQIVTEPVIKDGMCYPKLTAMDKNGDKRAYFSTNFNAETADLGEVTASVLINEDACFDVTKGVWFYWDSDSDPAKWVKATKATDSHWYSATLGTVNATSYTLGVGNDDELNWSTADRVILYSVTGKNPRFELMPSMDLEPADETANDHNYIPQDVTAVPDAATGNVDVTITVIDKAYAYWVGLIEKGKSDFSWIFTNQPKESETTSIHFTLDTRATKETEIEKVIVRAFNSSYNKYSTCAELAKALTFNIPQHPAYPTNLTAVEDDETITFSWDESEYAGEYYYKVMSGSSYLYGGYYPAAVIPVKDGKHYVVVDKSLGNTDYTFTVTAYDLEYNTIGGESLTHTATKSKALGDVTVRVLVPSDNNMDISGGLWLCYWFPGEDRKADGRFVEMTEKVAGSHWYECTFNETTNATFNHVFINESAWSSTSQYTWASGWSTANSICEELFYKYDGWSSWDAYTADCDAKDHNYTIKSVVADASKAGRVTLTITPEKQQAPRYDIEYRQYGMGESFSWLGRCEGATTFSAAFDFKVDRKYEFSVTPYDDNYNLMAASATCMAEITGNPNIPTDLKATVGADEQTVTFEWKKVGTETAYFGIKAYDYMVGTLRMDATKITEEKYVAKFPIPVGYSWTLTAYNASGEVLASVDGPDFTTNGPDLAPSNLNVAVNGKKATLAWKAPLAASFCGYLIEDSYTGDVIASGHVSGKNGQYSVTYSLDKDTTMMFAWYVISESAGKEPISVPMFGSTFTITGSKEDPTPGKQYTLNISAEAGGSVNDAVNGKWDEGAKVTIYAYPDWMWEFDEWSDGDKNATRKLIMDKDYTLVAKFKTTATFTLTISAGEHGKVNEEVNGTYTGGEKVTIKATPDKGYKFEMWSDGDTHATREITMTENLNLKASFVTIKYYTLEVDIDPGDEAGIILFNGTEESGNSVKVQEGTTVTLKAKANSGYTFKQFEDGGTKITSSEYDVVVTSNTTVTAVFSKNSSHAIENITVDGESATKVFHEGQIYIIREGNVYTPTGMKVK